MVISVEDSRSETMNKVPNFIVNQNKYRIDSYNPQTGAILDSLDLASESRTTYTVNIALNDHDLWILMAKELLRLQVR